MGRRAAAIAMAAAAAAAAGAVLYAGLDAGTQGVLSQPDLSGAEVPARIAESSNEFAFGFYREVSSKDENVFFSPPSMYVAFSALYEGAGGETAEQLQDTFGFVPNATARHNLTAHALASINRDDPHAELSMANALWLANWFEPHGGYLDVGRGVYLADVETASFTDPDDGVRRVNEWASDNTAGKIRRVLGPDSVDAMTAMVITNAIYFKGAWETQFQADMTEESDFAAAAGPVRADFMRMSGAEFGYAHSSGAQVLRMPYEGGRLSMLLILPEGGGSLREVTSEQVGAWRQEMRQTEVTVSVPKFSMKTKYDLVQHLRAMGVSDAFDARESDLSGIASVGPERRLYVSGASQDAFVEVNEEGTEAAAVTSMVLTLESAPPPPPRFTADRPFMFLILDDESGMILFMGRVSDPAAG